MPQVSSQALIKGILGASAVSLTFGAVQLASGRDLGPASQASVFQSSLASPEGGINRAAKADRATASSTSTERTRTVSLRLDGVSDTSVLVRVPLARDTSSAKPGERKTACEPVVSVLTEVAKQLEPGRCVT